MYSAANPKTTKQTIILKSFDSDSQHKEVLKRELAAPEEWERLLQSQCESEDDTIVSGRPMLGGFRAAGCYSSSVAAQTSGQTGAKDRDGQARGGLHRKREMAGGQATLAVWLKQWLSANGSQRHAVC